MADRTGPNRNDEGRLEHAVPSPTDSDTPNASLDGDSDSDDESTGMADLAASLRFLSESVARIEAAEKEMARAREASRIEAEKRRAESEARLTQMLLQTQLQIASLTRKRKRAQIDPSSNRERALLLSLLLHSNSMW